MADRVIFINQGRIIFDGTPAEMRGEHTTLDEAFRVMTCVPSSDCPARDCRVLQHADRLCVHFALRVPERDRGVLAGAVLRNQSGQPRSAQFVLSLPAGLFIPAIGNELVGGGEKQGTEDLLMTAARRGLGNRRWQVHGCRVHLHSRAGVFLSHVVVRAGSGTRIRG